MSELERMQMARLRRERDEALAEVERLRTRVKELEASYHAKVKALKSEIRKWSDHAARADKEVYDLTQRYDDLEADYMRLREQYRNAARNHAEAELRGLTEREAAALLDRSKDQVHRDVAKARAELRKVL